MSGEAAKPVEIVLANNDRVTVRVGETFLKIDAETGRADTEIEAMRLAPVPTATILWHQPPVLALRRVPGSTLGRLGEPCHASREAWAATGRTLRTLHDAPLPQRIAPGIERRAARLDDETDWLRTNRVLPSAVLDHAWGLARRALRPRPLAFVHGDLHIEHVFVEHDEVTGIIDWSEAGRGDPLFDIASLVLGHPERLDDLLDGYGEVDRDLVHAWRTLRCLVAIRWLSENGYGDPETLPETAILRTLTA